MRALLSLVAGSGGRLALSAICLATVVLTATGHLSEAIRLWLVWASLVAVATLALATAATLAGVYDEETRP